MTALSKRAEKLWERICDGEFYPAYSEREPKAMRELVDAGLVSVCVRVQTIVACYVPRRGYKPFKQEQYKRTR